MSFKRKFAGAWILAAVVLAIPAAAQVTGSLSGTIADPNGMAVVNVRVVLSLHDSDVEEAATTTTGTGAFFFPALRPIFYDLRVEAPNFKTQTLTNVKVDPTTETSLPPLKLELGDVKTTVEAAAPTQTLQTANGEVSNTLTHDQVSALPLAQRDPLAQPFGLLDTLPGVSINGRSFATIDGQSVSFANITYDGINVQDNFIRSDSLQEIFLGLHNDQISEATIVTSNPGTIYSGGSAQVAFSTPTGGNTFHGSAYWLNIPRGISAQQFQDNADATPSTLQLNQAGGTVGGPIRKNKLFYFLNFETDQDRSTITQIAAVPTTPFSSQNPTIEQILKLIPSPSGYVGTGVFAGQGVNYATPRNSGDTTYLGLARLDYRASSKHVFSFSTAMNEALADEPGYSAPFGSQPGQARQADDSLQTVSTFFSGSWRWSPTPRLTNEVRIGVSLERADFMDALRSKYPFIFDFTDTNGLQPMSGHDPSGQNNRIYNYQDNVTYVKGSHSFQAGFSLQQYRESAYGIDYGPLSSVTLPTYTLDTTGVVTQETQPFGLSSPTSGYQAFTPPVTKPSANLVSGYFQDNWKLMPRLTINLGLRYDYLSPVEDNSGLAIIPTLSGGNAASAVYNPNLAFGFTGKSQGLYNADRNNFAPYVGFAWQPMEGLPVVVRGAYSISYVNDDLLRNMSTFNFQNGFQTFMSPTIPNVALQSVPAIPTPGAPTLSLAGLAKQYNGSAPPIFAVDPNLRTPYVQQANLGVETHLKGFLMSVRYVGNRLEKGLLSVDRNQVSLSPAFLAAFEQGEQAVNNNMYPNIPGLINGGGCFQVSKGQCISPDRVGLFYLSTGQPGSYAQHVQIAGYNTAGAYNFFASPLAPNGIDLLSNLGRSRYDSLQVSVSRRVSPGLSLTANYVYSKSLSNENDYQQGAINPFLDIHNPSLEWAQSPFNLKHAFKLTAIYNLPFARNASFSSLAHEIFGGWSISGIAIAQSGAPFSLLSSIGSFNTGANGGLNSNENTVSTNLNSSQIEQYFSVQKSPDGSVSYVNTPLTSGPSASQAFQEPAPGQVGNLPRRIFTGPSAFNVNLGIQKVISLTERTRVEFRAESINVFNRENWLVHDQFLCTSQFCGPVNGEVPAFATGGVTQWTPPRSLQFMLRVLF